MNLAQLEQLMRKQPLRLAPGGRGLLPAGGEGRKRLVPRRDVILGLASAALAPGAKALAGSIPAGETISGTESSAERVPWSHGVSLLGDLKYPKDFCVSTM